MQTAWPAALALLLARVSTLEAESEPPPGGRVLRVEGGLVQGSLRTDRDTRPYLSFRGVPYAAPPVGQLRFKEPQPVIAWNGVLDASREGPACPQRDVLYGRLMTTRALSEDCLTINVHVPLLPGHVLPTELPVLVFVHGGGFGFGSGDSDLHGPEYLVGKGVILVTFNYRLGALGFLTLGSPELPGNLGLRDAVAALQWVRRNIAVLGGDPDNVTLGGQSAGAAISHLLTMSPIANGLFQRAILMSGVATRSFFSTSPANGQRLAESLMKRLNITTTAPHERLQRLRGLPVDSIVGAASAMLDEEGLAVFVPVEDGAGGVLPQEPWAASVPLLIGHTDAECHTYARRLRDLNFTTTIKLNPLVLVPPSLIFASAQDRLPALIGQITQRYFTTETDDEHRLRRFMRYCSDAYFKYPAVKLAQTQAARGGAPVFLYEFAYTGGYSPIKAAVSGEAFDGAGHIEDMTFLLRTNSYPLNISDNADDDWAKQWMTILFTNYMKTGHPTPASFGGGGELVTWPAYSSAQESLVLNRTVTVQRRRHADLLRFFDQLHDPAPPADPRRHFFSENDRPAVALQTIDLRTNIDK